MIRDFSGWSVALIPGTRPESGTRALKYYLNSVLPDTVLTQMASKGYRYFKYLIVRDEHQRMPEYSTQRCPAGYPIMTVLVASNNPIDGDNPETLRVIKQALNLL
jgi:hypothetical protein